MDIFIVFLGEQPSLSLKYVRIFMCRLRTLLKKSSCFSRLHIV